MALRRNLKFDAEVQKKLHNEYKRGYMAGRMSKTRTPKPNTLLTLDGGNVDVTDFIRSIAEMPDCADTRWVNIRDCARVLAAQASKEGNQL